MTETTQSKLDGTTRGLGLLLIGMAGFTTWDQWAIWSTKDDYTFGYLVPFFSAYVLWDRWEELRALLTGERTDVAAPTSKGVLTLAQLLAFASLALFGFGAAARAIFGTGIGPTLAICFGLAGTALAFAFLSVRGPSDDVATSASRWRAVGLLLFPACVWLISGPFLYLVDNQVGVAEACSGIRSLSACVFAGAFLGAVFLEGGFPGVLLRRVAMIGLAALAAILLNIGRNTYLTFHALHHGSKSLERDFAGVEHGQAGFSSLGTVHDVAGNIAMVAALILLIALIPMLNRLGRPRDNRPSA